MAHEGREAAESLTWEVVDALEEVLDHWEDTLSAR